ncbi:MAG: CRISPR-associated protein Cas4 [Lachnospiraceae bacterium]|nr:CRISPR-associated protein Cas4 [Lachnospiraceae bacterium]MDE7201421.1 CRISPR-associated protein Cas4 [Lachnospiraceae bacterium]
MYAEDDYLMLSGIQHFAFCRRQWAIIHIEQQWAENYRTTAGELMHKKAHDEDSFEKRGNLLIVRGLRISSHELGMSGQCDVVEFHQNNNGVELFGYDGKWDPIPIEYKHGVPKENNADELQLCAQAVCLEEMFQTNIPEGFLYYGENRRRSRVEFTDTLRDEVYKIAKEMHDLFCKGYTPNVKPTKQCKSCSLENLCVPKLQKAVNVRAYIEQGIKTNDL